MKSVALICPALAGHHESYLRLYAHTLLEAGYRVAAFTPKPDNLTTWIAHTCPNQQDQLATFDLVYSREFHVPGPFSIFFDKIAWVKFVANMVRASGVQPDLVFHTWLDYCLTPGLTATITDLIVPYQWSGLYFHPWYLRQNLRYARLRRSFLTNHAALLSHRCPAVAVLDEGIADQLQEKLHGKPVIVFPDVADDSPLDRDFPPIALIRARAQGRVVIGLLGSLAKRKGMVMLMDVVQQASHENWYFVFAGELMLNSFLPEEHRLILDWVKSPPSNCYFYTQRISDEGQFNAIIDECDILFAVYQNFLSSSNLLTKAALFEKPIIVSDAYCMGERVRHFGLGLTVDETSVPQCLAAIRQLSDQLARDGRFTTARFGDYRQMHSIDQLRVAFNRLLSAARL